MLSFPWRKNTFENVVFDVMLVSLVMNFYNELILSTNTDTGEIVFFRSWTNDVNMIYAVYTCSNEEEKQIIK